VSSSEEYGKSLGALRDMDMMREQDHSTESEALADQPSHALDAQEAGPQRQRQQQPGSPFFVRCNSVDNTDKCEN